MPIYEFECRGCGHRFDRLQKLSEDDPTVCPACGEPLLHRRVSAPSFRLAGSGWYETDFKKEGDKKRNLADTPTGSDAKPASDAKPVSDTPAAKVPPATSASPAPAPVSKTSGND